jgi:hypothetical protein
MLAPTQSPASRTSGVSPLATRCAAATRPTGPAPITATGSFATGDVDGRAALEALGTYTASFWQPQVAAGAEQHAPVSGFGVGSPQHAAPVGASVASDAVLAGAAEAPQQALGWAGLGTEARAASGEVDGVDMAVSPVLGVGWISVYQLRSI